MTNKELEKKVIELEKKLSQLSAIKDAESIFAYADKGVKATLELIAEQQPKEEFEVGAWYANNGMPMSMVCYSGKGDGYGTWSGSNWGNSWAIDQIDNWTKATPQEIETALISEAKKRGFKEGVRFKMGDVDYGYSFDSDRDFTYKGELMLGKSANCGHIIFRDGKWATIIEDSFEIAGHKVEGCGDNIQIGCSATGWHIDIEIIRELRNTLIDLNLDSVNHKDAGKISLKELMDLIAHVENRK